MHFFMIGFCVGLGIMGWYAGLAFYYFLTKPRKFFKRKPKIYRSKNAFYKER